MPRWSSNTVLPLLLAALTTSSASAQKPAAKPSAGTVPFHAYLPLPEELGPEATVADEGPSTSWGGAEGYSREFGEFGGEMISIGGSQVITLTMAVERFEGAFGPGMVITMFAGMSPDALGDLFLQGAQAEIGGQMVDSLTVAPLPPPSVGESSVLFRIGWHASFMRFDMLLLLVARGDRLASIVAMGPQDEMFPEDLEGLAVAVDRRIQDPTTIPAAALAPPQRDRPVDDLPDAFDDVAPAWTEDDVVAALDAAGIDLEAMLPSASDLSDEGSSDGPEWHPVLGGIGGLSLDLEGDAFFTVGQSSLGFLSIQVDAFETADAALLGLLSGSSLLDDEDALRQSAAVSGELPEGMEFILGPSFTPALGDRAVGRSITLQSSVFELEMILVFFVRGAFSASLAAMSGPGAMQAEDVVRAAELVDRRIREQAPAAASAARGDLLLRVQRALDRARRGELDGALREFRGLAREDATVAEMASVLGPLCQWGALWDPEAGDDVEGICDRAVAAAGDHLGPHRDRGIARAMRGDYPGAVEDLAAYSAWPRDASKRREVRGWIAALEGGRNPFTEEVRERLRAEAVEF